MASVDGETPKKRPGRPRKGAKLAEKSSAESRPKRNVSVTKKDQSVSWREERQLTRAMRASMSTAAKTRPLRATTTRMSAAATTSGGWRRSPAKRVPKKEEISDVEPVIPSSPSDDSDDDVPTTENFLDFLVTRNDPTKFGPRHEYFNALLQQTQSAETRQSQSSTSNVAKSPLKSNLQRARNAVKAAKTYVSPKKIKLEV